MSRIARPLLYAGVLAAVVGLSKLHAAEVGTYDYTGSSRFAWSFAYIALLALAAYGVGLPDVPRSRRGAVAWSLAAAGSAALAMSGLQLLVGDALLPRFVVLGSAFVLMPWYLLCVAIAVDTRAFEERRERVVVVGDHPEATSLGDELDHLPEAFADVVATVSVADAAVSSTGRPLVEAVERARGSVLVLDRAAQADPSVVAEAAALHEGGVRIRTLSLFYEEWLGKLPMSELERVSLMFDIGELHRARYGRLKRLFDLTLAVPGFVALVVVLPFVLVGDTVANRGPLLYRQDRVGKGGAHFRILKFRTMRTEAGTASEEWTGRDDPRITPFGRLLRTTHVDELPQVVNIFRGELSVVGPRPEQPRYVEELVDKLPFYDLRHLVRPGLTGWAQVKYGYAGDERDALEKLQYEFFYLRHQGLALDLRIVGRTVRSVVAGDGR